MLYFNSFIGCNMYIVMNVEKQNEIEKWYDCVKWPQTGLPLLYTWYQHITFYKSWILGNTPHDPCSAQKC